MERERSSREETGEREKRSEMESAARVCGAAVTDERRSCSCRCIEPVARRSRGERRGRRRVADEEGDNGNRFDRQLLRCRLSFQSPPSPPLLRCPPPESSFCVSFSPFPPGLRPVVLLRFFFSRRSLVNQTLTKPHHGLSCRAARDSSLVATEVAPKLRGETWIACFFLNDSLFSPHRLHRHGLEK